MGTINMNLEKVYNEFKIYCKLNKVDAPEINLGEMKKIVEKYLSFDRLSDAISFKYNIVGDYIHDTHDQIDFKLGFEKYSNTTEYKQWQRHNEVAFAISATLTHLEDEWVKIHGKVHTDEEAAEIAAKKWCELIFGWHLQDNGALNEEHSFLASAIATSLGNDTRKKISEDVKRKAYNLFYQYYYHELQYMKTSDIKHIEWLRENIKGNEKFPLYKLNYPLHLYCDYEPVFDLYQILFSAGVDEKHINILCPWKTGIRIRYSDNTVFYNTYQREQEL